jgi:hypothetical protein
LTQHALQKALELFQSQIGVRSISIQTDQHLAGILWLANVFSRASSSGDCTQVGGLIRSFLTMVRIGSTLRREFFAAEPNQNETGVGNCVRRE